MERDKSKRAREILEELNTVYTETIGGTRSNESEYLRGVKARLDAEIARLESLKDNRLASLQLSVLRSIRDGDKSE